MTKKLLNVSAGINLVIGGIILLFSLFITNIRPIAVIGGVGVVFAAIRLIIGATFLSSAKKEGKDFFDSRWYVLAASIGCLITCHLISALLGFISFSEMVKLPNETEEITSHIEKKMLSEEEKSEKRLKTLLALGCGLVLLAGIIFARTTWTSLSGGGKTITLIISTLIFSVLSYLSEKKFGLKASAVTYYILAEAFCVFSFVAAGYFNIFGSWFSLNGEGSDLYNAFLMVIISVLTYFAYLKYNKVNLFYIFDFALLVGLISVLSFCNIGHDFVLLVVLLVLAVFSLVSKGNEIIKLTNNFARVLLPIASFMLFTFITGLKADDRLIFYVISFGVAFIVTYYLAIINKELFYEVFAPIFTIGTAFSLIAFIGSEVRIMFLQLLLITLIVYIIGYYKREQKSLFTSTAIICDLGLLYVFFDSLSLDYNYYAIASGLGLLGTSLAVFASRKFSKYYFEILLEPVKVILLAYSVYKLIYKFEYVENGLFLAIIGVIFALICIFRKDFMKKLYFISSILVVVFSIVSNVSEYAPIAQILAVIALGILLGITFKAKESELRSCREAIYGGFLIVLALATLNIFDNFDLKLIGIILLTILYSALFIIFNKNNIFRCFTIVALLIPYIIILPISVWNDKVNYILYSLPWLALIFIYTRGFLASVRLKTVNIIEIIVLAIWYLAVSALISLEVAIFIGVISFISILIGYRSEAWSSLYYTGVIFLVLNMLIQLKEFWTSIPIWAYILVAGLTLIGIVAYKEYAKINKVEKVEKVEPELINEKEEVTTFSGNVDIRTVIIGSSLYLVFIPIFLQIIG